MNFEVLPELRWQFGYAFFWMLVLVIVLSLLFLMRRARIL
jgi:Mg2+ and Co2+ transporter CorA